MIVRLRVSATQVMYVILYGIPYTFGNVSDFVGVWLVVSVMASFQFDGIIRVKKELATQSLHLQV